MSIILLMSAIKLSMERRWFFPLPAAHISLSSHIFLSPMTHIPENGGFPLISYLSPVLSASPAEYCILHPLTLTPTHSWVDLFSNKPQELAPYCKYDYTNNMELPFLSLFLSKPKYKVFLKYMDSNSEQEAIKLSITRNEIPDLF